jgi:hypothetical protein
MNSSMVILVLVKILCIRTIRKPTIYNLGTPYILSHPVYIFLKPFVSLYCSDVSIQTEGRDRRLEDVSQGDTRNTSSSNPDPTYNHFSHP